MPRPAKLPDVPWFESDAMEAHLEAARLDPGARAFVRDLARDGVAAVDLGDEARGLCDLAVAETEGGFPPGASRLQDAWYRSRAARRLATWPRLRDLLRAAYGRDPFPFQTLSFRRGSEQRVHSDAIHFHSVPERFMAGVWIALEDVRPEAGPLVYHPGSHRLPVLTMREAGVAHDPPTLEDYVRLYEPRLAERLHAAGLEQVWAVLPKGWAFVWAANLAHGGSAIVDPAATRRSLVVHHYFEDCVYYTPLTSDVERGRLSLRLPPNIRTGGWGWPSRDGRPIWPGAGQVARAVLRDLRRRPAAH